MNNFDEYYFVYKDSLGEWNSATNPVFIAEHKYCRAVKKNEWESVMKLLNTLNSGELNL